MMTWWLQKGIDGFRMDVINLLSKAPSLPDVIPRHSGEYKWGGEYFVNGPRIHEFLKEMNERVLNHFDIMTVGECIGISTADALRFTNEVNGALNMILQFEHVQIDCGPNGRWDVRQWTPKDLKKNIMKWQMDLNGAGWNSIYFSNHDQPRSLSRFGDGRGYREQSAKMLATLLLTLKGTPYIYQGEEIGMTNCNFATIDEYRDVDTLNYYRKAMKDGIDENVTMQIIRNRSRDNARTPMQWDNSRNAGFTAGTPWIGVNPNYVSINVEAARGDTNSIHSFYKKLIALRKSAPALIYGTFRVLAENDEQIFAYLREFESERFVIAINYSNCKVHFEVPHEIDGVHGKLILSNYDANGRDSLQSTDMTPYESSIYRLMDER